MPDPFTIAAIAAPVVGGVLGNILSGDDRDAAQRNIQEIYTRYANLPIPDTEKMRLALEDYQSVGNLNAEKEVAEQLAMQDALQNIELDPRLRQAQMQQLESLAKLGETSFTPEEQAQLNKMRRQVEGDATARTKAMLEEQTRRGLGSSDAGLAARLQGAQSSANRQAEQADELAAMAFRRALEAKAGAASLGGSIEDRAYGQEAAIANALNARERANVDLRTRASERNIDRTQSVNEFNLRNAQRLSEGNVDLRNKQQQYNKELEQREFENQLAKYGAMSGAQQNLAGMHQASADRTAKMWSGIGSGIGQGAMTYGMSKPTGDTVNTQKVNAALEPFKKGLGSYDPNKGE